LFLFHLFCLAVKSGLPGDGSGGGGGSAWALVDQTGAAIVSAVVTITIASPGVVSLTAHGFAANQAVIFSTTGALPTGLTAGTVYYVRNPAANTFEVSATVGGASINTSGTQSGVHSVRKAATWTFSAAAANVDVVGLGAYTDIQIVARGLSASVSGNRNIIVSVDNGATFFNTSGDYVSVTSAGVEAAASALLIHDTASTAARTFMGLIEGSGSSDGPKWGIGIGGTTNQHRLFVASTLPINAVRLVTSGGGNLTAGSLFVYVR